MAFMSRPRGDHERRRAEVAEAVWQVLSTDGFGGLTVRAIAGRMQATTGVVTHYFRSKREVIGYALDLLDRRSGERHRRTSEPGMAAVRAALLDMLPLDAESITANRIWVSSWDRALADPDLRRDHGRRYAAGVDRLAALVVIAQDRGELATGEPRDVAAGLQSFALGLTVQALLDPESYPAATQVTLVEAHLRQLG